MKRKQKLGGLSTNYLIGFLGALNEPKSFTKFYMSNPVTHKKSFLKYVNWCLERKFINKIPSNQYMIYSLTQKGRKLWELIE